MAESPKEKQALEKLDEATRGVAWDEFDKEKDRELHAPRRWWRGPRFGGLWFSARRPRLHRVKGDPVYEPVDDPDPGDERGLRDVLRDVDKKT